MNESAFESLRRAQPSPEARERLHQACRELALQENDALWGLLHLVQDYCASLGPTRSAPTPRQPDTTRWVFQPWQLVCAGLAVQAGMLALAFFVGRNWGSALPPETSVVRAVLSVPAGWMMFLLGMPTLIQGIASSWLARKRDRVVGWLLLCAFSGALVASVTALVWLIF